MSLNILTHCGLEASEVLFPFGESNDLSPLQCQATTIVDLFIANWTIRNKLPWTFNQNTKIQSILFSAKQLPCCLCSIVEYFVTAKSDNLISWWHNTTNIKQLNFKIAHGSKKIFAMFYNE